MRKPKARAKVLGCFVGEHHITSYVSFFRVGGGGREGQVVPSLPPPLLAPMEMMSFVRKFEFGQYSHYGNN